MQKLTFSAHDVPAPMTRKERAVLVDRVVMEAARDPVFAQHLADNLQGAGVTLTPRKKRSGRPDSRSHTRYVRLLSEFGLLLHEGMSAKDAQAHIGKISRPVLSPASVGNMLTVARKSVHPEDIGPMLRALVFT
jgi:hypothetical protein